MCEGCRHHLFSHFLNVVTTLLQGLLTPLLPYHRR